MRSSIRYFLIAVGALALMVGTFVALRPRLEQKVKAQNLNQVAACNPAANPSKTNLGCIVISAFRENGPGTTGSPVQGPAAGPGYNAAGPAIPSALANPGTSRPGTGSTDEFVEIFNASARPVTVSSLSDDPLNQGIGVYVSSGQGFNPGPGSSPAQQAGEYGSSNGQAVNASQLACQLPPNTVIKGRSWVLCAGRTYSLGNLGGNGGRYDARPDFIIGNAGCPAPPGGAPFYAGSSPNATVCDIPDDAGIALLNVASSNVTTCLMGSLNCPTGFLFSSGGVSGSAVVLDKVGFHEYGSGSPVNTGPGVYPANLYPSLAAQYCEGPLFFDNNGVLHSPSCLEAIGDATTIPQPPGLPCPPTGVGPNNGAQNPPNPTYGTGAPTSPIVQTTQEPGTVFPVDQGVGGGLFIRRADGQLSSVRKCYGESGQYKVERRRDRSTELADSGSVYRDSWRSSPTSAEYTAGGSNGLLGPFNTNGNPPTLTPGSPATATPYGVGACAGSTTGGLCGSSEDWILDSPNPTSFNVGASVTGVSSVRSVLGSAGIHSCAGTAGVSTVGANNCNSATQEAGSPPIIGNTLVTLNVFDPNCGSLFTCPGFANAERRYSQDASIQGAANDPLGVLILRFRLTNNTIGALRGGRFRLNDMSLPCGSQSYAAQGSVGAFGQTTTVGTQAARNLRGPDPSITPILTPTPTCGTAEPPDGSDSNATTAIFKGLNQVGEFVVDSTFTQQNVWGSVIEDVSVPSTAPALPGAPGVLTPLGGGSDTSYVLQTQVIGGLGAFPTAGGQNMWPLFGPFTNVGGTVGFAGAVNIAPNVLPPVFQQNAGGVNNGIGSFAAMNLASGATLRVGFKLGVVKAGRAKILIGREIFGPTPLP